VSLVALVTFLVPAAARADPINLLVNGSFELGPLGCCQDIDVPAVSSAIPGWTVFATSASAGAIDYLNPPWLPTVSTPSILMEGIP
jgi:hypothetical protein